MAGLRGSTSFNARSFRAVKLLATAGLIALLCALVAGLTPRALGQSTNFPTGMTQHQIRQVDIPQIDRSVLATDRPRVTDRQADGSAIVALDAQQRQALNRSVQSQLPAMLDLTGATRVFAFDGGILQRESGQETLFVPFAVAVAPLNYDREREMLTGELLVFFGEQDRSNFQQASDLPSPVEIRLTGASWSDPERLTFSRSSEAQQVAVGFWRNAADRTITLISPQNPNMRKKLEFSAQPYMLMRAENAIEGLGLETTTVHVEVYGLANPEGRRVRFTADDGVLSERSVELGADGTASVDFTSDFVGSAPVTASMPRAGTVSRSIDMQLPLRSLGMMLIGTAIGFLIRLSRRKGRKTNKFGLFMGSLLGGLVGWLLYVAGVNWIAPITVKAVGALLIIVLSLLGAWIGINTLGAILRNMGLGSNEPAEAEQAQAPAGG